MGVELIKFRYGYRGGRLLDKIRQETKDVKKRRFLVGNLK